MRLNTVYLKCLGLHGSIFLWRLLKILFSVAAFSVLGVLRISLKSRNSRDSERDIIAIGDTRDGYFWDGTPWPENHTDPSFPDDDIIYYGNSRGHPN